MSGSPVSAGAGGLAAVAFTAIAALHGYWALGGLWPGRDEESLALLVVGGQPGMRMPGRAATWVVVLLLLLAAATVLATGGLVIVPVAERLVRGGAFLGAGVLLLRGILGFFFTWIRPASAASPFARLNVLLYSPLCLALALLTVLAASR